MIMQSVLIVDDNLDFGEGLKSVLKDEGFDVTYASSGSDAMLRSREKRFDITFMDMKLPDMTGVEALMEIIKIYADARVIMMSGYRVHDLLNEALERGAESVLNKPFQSSRCWLKLIAMSDPEARVAYYLRQIRFTTGKLRNFFIIRAR